jgi:hypothetical protein
MSNPLSNLVTKPFIPIYWNGASGTRYEFQLDTIGVIYRSIPGVYIFCRHTGNGKGMSRSLLN